MADGNGSGCLQGQVVLRIPMLDPDDVTIAFKGVVVTLVAREGSSEATTDSEGLFRFDGLSAGTYRLCVDETMTRDDSSQFQLLDADRCQWVEIPPEDTTESTYASVAGECVDVGAIVYTIEFPGEPAGVGMGRPDEEILINNTVSSIAGIEAALRDMATYPFSGPSDTESGAYPAGSTRRPAAASNGVRSGVTSALAGLGIMGELTDDDLARLFPADTDEDGEVSYRWAGPAVTTRSSARSAGARKPGTVQVSGALARFQQKAKVALTEIQEVLATIQPFDGHDVDPRTVATQKTIVLQTMQSIVNEPERPDGLRQLAVDLHFKSLLKDEIVVDRYGTTVEGNLGVLKDLLGISDALVSDQEAETHVTEWNRVEDAAESARDAWLAYKKKSSKPELRFGERLQELHGYFGALSEAAQDARAMLRTVRFTPQEQATQKFSTPAGDEITTDDLLSMVEDLANEIGPTYITDWKGRGIATVGARATSLRDTTDGMIATGRFPFSSPRVREAFVDITRLLDETAIVCDKIKADMLPAGVAGFGAP